MEIWSIVDIEYVDSFKFIMDCLYDLPINSRKLLMERYLENKTLKEIGIDLNLSPEGTRKRIKKILKKIQEE